MSGPAPLDGLERHLILVWTSVVRFPLPKLAT